LGDKGTRLNVRRRVELTETLNGETLPYLILGYPILFVKLRHRSERHTAGMSANDPLPIPAHLLTSSMFVGDVVAGHGVTHC
jgi:hypothetical protein